MTFYLDESLRLTKQGDDVFTAKTDSKYWNLIGPYGGWIAALLMKTILEDNDVNGFEPVALTVDFMKAPAEGPIVVKRSCDRAGRTMSFWRADMETADGKPCARAMLTLAAQRETLDFSQSRMSEVPPAESIAIMDTQILPIKWARLYETRVALGQMGATNPDSRSLVWIREADGRPLDHISLTAICDSPFPRLFLATGRPSNISTVSMTTFFHASRAELGEIGNAPILADSHCERSTGGFYDQHARFFAADGRLLAASQQMVWYDRPI